MQLPPLKRLTTEDFKDQSKWIGKLLFPLNQFFQVIFNGLNKNITFQENIAADVKNITFTNNSAEYPIRVKNSLASTPLGLWVINCRDISTTPSTLSGQFPVQCSFTYDDANKQILISTITGLVEGQRYSIDLVVIPRI